MFPLSQLSMFQLFLRKKLFYLDEGWYQSFQLDLYYEQQLPEAHDGGTVQAPVPNDDSFDRECG